MRIYKTDDQIVALAKMGAMICQYAIRNPFHVSFEDGNFHKDWDLAFERKYNEEYRGPNGERMYQFICDFIDGLEALDGEERVAVYKLVRRKWSYLDGKWRRKILANSKPKEDWQGFMYKHYLDPDGHIYVETDLGVKLKQF